jgi:hypothetical protein
MAKCLETEHHYFCAEVVGVSDEGTAHVLIFCTACGDFLHKIAKVSSPGTQLRLLREEKRVGLERQRLPL